jgi:sulfatase modifying factor 1
VRSARTAWAALVAIVPPALVGVGCSIFESFPDYPADASVPLPVVDAGQEADGPASDASDAGPPRDATLEASEATGDSGCDTCTTSPPSCEADGAGLVNCGASSESCCVSLPVGGGPFNRTYTNAGQGASGQADPASVSTFRLDKYEVTVGRYRQFITAWNGGWRPAAASGRHVELNAGMGLANSADPGTYETGWATGDDVEVSSPPNVCDPSFGSWTPSVGGNEAKPINCVNWFEAYAFCIWDGGFLPSDAEREYAAAGGSEEREYPWGNADPGMGSLFAIYGCFYPDAAGGCVGVANLAPVGTAAQGAGAYYQLDLVGEVGEWTLDWAATFVDPCTDCAYLTEPAPLDGAPAARVVHGGLFDFLLTVSSQRGSIPPTDRHPYIGVRCARTP